MSKIKPKISQRNNMTMTDRTSPLATVDFHDNDTPDSIPPLHILTKMQNLRIAGCSEKEAEEMCKPQQLTEEEIEFLEKEEIKQARKELRRLERNLRLEEDRKMWEAISKKRQMSL